MFPKSFLQIVCRSNKRMQLALVSENINIKHGFYNLIADPIASMPSHSVVKGDGEGGPVPKLFQYALTQLPLNIGTEDQQQHDKKLS